MTILTKILQSEIEILELELEIKRCLADIDIIRNKIASMKASGTIEDLANMCIERLKS